MSGIQCRPGFTFWLTFLKNPSIMLLDIFLVFFFFFFFFFLKIVDILFLHKNVCCGYSLEAPQ